MTLVRTFTHENPVSDEMKDAIKWARVDREEIKRLKAELTLANARAEKMKAILKRFVILEECEAHFEEAYERILPDARAALAEMGE